MTEDEETVSVEIHRVDGRYVGSMRTEHGAVIFITADTEEQCYERLLACYREGPVKAPKP